MLKKIYTQLGHGVCRVKDGEIAESYLLSDEEVEFIKEIAKLTTILPEKFKLGVFEHEKGKVVILRYGEEFICFPAKSENVMELIKKAEVEIYDKILSH